MRSLYELSNDPKYILVHTEDHFFNPVAGLFLKQC